MMNLNIQQFGGRGASSSTSNNKINSMYIRNNEGKVEKLDMSEVEKIEDAGNRYEIRFNDGVASISKDNVVSINGKDTQSKQTKISTFTGSKNLDKALENGYSFYRGEDLNSSGRNYKEIATRLKAEGYKVRVFEDTTRVRGLHNYTVLYKRK